MPKMKWAIDTDEPDELEPFDVYDGEDPPKGVYRCSVRRLVLKENKNGDDMINGLLIVNEPKGSPKAKYNGFAIWFNQNITDQGKPYVLQFLKALGLTWTDFVRKTVTADAEKPTNIMKIGTVKFNDGSEPFCRIATKNGRDQNQEKQVQVSTWLPPKDADEEWDDDDGDDGDAADGDEPPF